MYTAIDSLSLSVCVCVCVSVCLCVYVRAETHVHARLFVSFQNHAYNFLHFFPAKNMASSTASYIRQTCVDDFALVSRPNSHFLGKEGRVNLSSLLREGGQNELILIT